MTLSVLPLGCRSPPADPPPCSDGHQQSWGRKNPSEGRRFPRRNMVRDGVAEPCAHKTARRGKRTAFARPLLPHEENDPMPDQGEGATSVPHVRRQAAERVWRHPRSCPLHSWNAILEYADRPRLKRTPARRARSGHRPRSKRTPAPARRGPPLSTMRSAFPFSQVVQPHITSAHCAHDRLGSANPAA